MRWHTIRGQVDNLTVKEVAAKFGCSEMAARDGMARNGVKHRYERNGYEDRMHWHRLGAEVALKTCESIDSICERLELDSKLLIKLIYGEVK